MRQTETQPTEDEILELPPGWRNMYARVGSGSITWGVFVWETKAKAEAAAHKRPFPEIYDYLGAFEVAA